VAMGMGMGLGEGREWRIRSWEHGCEGGRGKERLGEARITASTWGMHAASCWWMGK
jgi:hypothetical protein